MKKWPIIGIVASVIGAACGIVEFVADLKCAKDEELDLERKLEDEYGLIKLKGEEENE